MLPLHENLTEVASAEATLAYISLPNGILCLLTCLIVFGVVIKSAFDAEDDLDHTIWKPRIVFVIFSLISTMFGVFFGVYGGLFTYQRIHHTFDYGDRVIFLYLFICHRLLTMGGDLFPSLDRCAAILSPLKYYTQATPCAAFSKFKVLMRSMIRS